MDNKICPHCGIEMSQYQGLTLPDTTPSAGDIIICAACLNLSIYDKDLNLTKPDESILKEMPKEFKEDLDLIIKNLKKQNEQR